jgi:ubiquinol-cytochrome c reductase iron-sulfur subunit
VSKTPSTPGGNKTADAASAASPDEEKAFDRSRRRFLITATSVVGAVGVASAAVPFIGSMNPSRKALADAQPVDVDISKLKPAELITVVWRHKPVWVLRRTHHQLAILPSMDPELKDPHNRQPQQPPHMPKGVYAYWRSIKKEYLVLVGICTHLGCIPDYVPQPGGSLGPSWRGGFHCPCHGSMYDFAGRVLIGSPAPLNLPVPPYHYLSDTVIRVGSIGGVHKEENWAPEIW